jgi:AcrR family transcriptional regulator
MNLDKMQKDEQTKSRIIDSACFSFANRGYHETTMQDIAEATGFSKGGVYYYFSSKEDVLYAIHDRFIREGLGRLKAVEIKYRSPEERLAKLFQEHLGIIHDYKDDITLFFRTLGYLNKENYVLVKEKRDAYEQIFLNAIEDGVSQGIFDISHARVSTLFILGSFNFMHTWYNPEGEMDISDLSDIFVNLWMNGLKKR